MEELLVASGESHVDNFFEACFVRDVVQHSANIKQAHISHREIPVLRVCLRILLMFRIVADPAIVAQPNIVTEISEHERKRFLRDAVDDPRLGVEVFGVHQQDGFVGLDCFELDLRVINLGLATETEQIIFDGVINLSGTI